MVLLIMNKILSAELREQAGSNSFNRFDYQVYWIVYHMINEYKRGSEFYIFCEFHDDFTKTDLTDNPNCVEFFQIKTSEKFKEWTLSRLTKTNEKPSGNIKHSFLGFIFYNFWKFEDECKKCHFVSNVKMDKKIRLWQSIIEDGKKLKEENIELYNEIKSLLKKEFIKLEESVFNNVFDIFIQNTFIYYGELTLENYEKVVAGEFFKLLDNHEIYTSNSNKILVDIIEEVRKKSKKKIETPISFKSLKETKGISSKIFDNLKSQLRKTPQNSELYNQIEEFLLENNYPKHKCKLLIRKLKKHHTKLLDISNLLYQDTTNKLINHIDEILYENFDEIENISLIKEKVMDSCLELIKDNDDFDRVLVEAILYERFMAED